MFTLKVTSQKISDSELDIGIELIGEHHVRAELTEPLIYAGLICLWQEQPELFSEELKAATRKRATQTIINFLDQSGLPTKNDGEISDLIEKWSDSRGGMDDL